VTQRGSAAVTQPGRGRGGAGPPGRAGSSEPPRAVAARRVSPPGLPVARPEGAAAAAGRGGVVVRTFAGATRKGGCRRDAPGRTRESAEDAGRAAGMRGGGSGTRWRRRAEACRRDAPSRTRESAEDDDYAAETRGSGSGTRWRRRADVCRRDAQGRLPPGRAWPDERVRRGCPSCGRNARRRRQRNAVASSADVCRRDAQGRLPPRRAWPDARVRRGCPSCGRNARRRRQRNAVASACGRLPARRARPAAAGVPRWPRGASRARGRGRAAEIRPAAVDARLRRPAVRDRDPTASRARRWGDPAVARRPARARPSEPTAFGDCIQQPATRQPATRQPGNPTTRQPDRAAAWRPGGLAAWRPNATALAAPRSGGLRSAARRPAARGPAAGCRRRRRPAAAVSASRSSC
jgi:predicted  nucleic acid-binding Zn-ribbon protein